MRKDLKLIVEDDRDMGEMWHTICTISDAIVRGRRTYTLLRGDPGTGKGRSAEAIRRLTKKKLVTVNCAAIPDAIAESELFGHERGAFTGADKRKPGFFGMAGEDILFLDELDGLRKSTQQKVLAVTEDPFVYRLVGGNDELVFNGHMVAAISHEMRGDLGSAFESRFDYDVRIPTLGQRSKGNQVRLFDMLARSGGILIAPDMRDEILKKTHNGNVRNLAKLIRRLADRAARLQTDTVTKDMVTWATEYGTREHEAGSGNVLVGELPTGTLPEVTQKVVGVVEKRMIENALRKTRGHVGKTAKMLGLSRRSIADKIALHAIDKQQFKDGAANEEEEDDE